MPSLNWIGKEKIVNHDKEVPFRLLKKHKSLSLGTSENLIIEGDNLEALKALMPYYVGKVKCIYIDPPYNTGNEKWVYNDNVNSPKIRQWLNKEVKIDDLTRHDKWLCMMYPRLKLLRDLLSDDGLIFISIDDNEHCNLKQIMDELFGEENFLTTFMWKKKGTSTNVIGSQVSSLTEFIVCYKKTERARISQRVRFKETRNYPLKDKLGNYRLTIIEKKNAGEYKRDSMQFEILGIKPRQGKRWQIGLEKAKELESNGRFINYEGVIKLKIYDFEDRDTYSAQPNLLEDHGTTDEAAKLLAKIFGEQEIFSNPKPVNLIKHLINISTEKNDIVLDSFAGSGTTGHAVLELNKEDTGNRKFILVELEKDIAQKITSERIRRISKDLNGNFEYCTLGNKLFNSDGAIDEEVDFADLANYIYFTETQTNLDKKQISGNFISEHRETDFYLLYKEKGKNTLTKSFLKGLKKSEHKKIVYADFCTIPEDILQSYNIIFKQIPYEVKVY